MRSGTSKMTKIEDTSWNPPPKGHQRPSVCTLLLRELEVGDVKKLYHEDVWCEGHSYDCSLSNELRNLRKMGWIVKTYHLAPHVVVVKRIK